MRYFLSLGSNLGDRKKNLTHALSLLKKEGIEILKISSLYETQPVDTLSLPWFYNQVIEVNANFSPMTFLSLIKKIEQKMGRRPAPQKAPRRIDIDILLADRTVIRSKKLKIPHPQIEKRNFVLIPFTEISPETVHPTLNEKIKDLWKKSNDRSTVKQITKKEIYE